MRLNPPWQPVQLIEPHRGISDGNEVHIRLPLGPFAIRWRLKHRGYAKDREFVDEQLLGPFRSWTHRHLFEQDSAGCRLTDAITYELPLSPFSDLAARWKIESDLARVFAYRHRVTASDLCDHVLWSSRPLRILMSGASGLIGSALGAYLSAGGHTVHRLVRRAPITEDEREWNPLLDRLDPELVSGYDVIIHLAGENIAARRWSATQREAIRTSRTRPTRVLSEAIAACSQPPQTFLVASAIGIYGDRSDIVLDESSAPGTGFLSEVGKGWEDATHPAIEKGVRTVTLRFGMVLDPRGGALGKMLLPFQLGLGGRLGSGKQWMSWIALDDALRAVLYLIHNASISGPINLTAPHAVTNGEFSSLLGMVLRRPTIAAMPTFAARALFGSMADELLLASQRVRPAALLKAGFAFRYPELEQGLRHCLGRM